MIEVVNILFLVLFAYTGFGVFYSLIFALASVFYKDKKYKSTNKQARIAVFIPGYKEDVIIYHVAKHALKQNYPQELYDVIVCADSFSDETVAKLRSLPIIVQEVSFEKSTKAKSLNKVMDILEEKYDIAVVLDADNLMKEDVLQKVNEAYQGGEKAIQCHRTAKNLDTNFARLDALSEEINNSIFRRGHIALGMPSALIGSGMAFDYLLYKSVMKTIDVVSGFDKELEIKLLKMGIKVSFIENAIVLDEKVQTSEVFQKQRTRWLAAQVNFAIKYFAMGLWYLLSKGRAGLFDKALQFVLLPRAFALASSVFLLLVAIILGNWTFIWSSVVLVSAFVLAMLLAIPKYFLKADMLKALMQLPKAIIRLLLSFLKINKAKDSFIHTPHTHIEPENENK
jgi:cellulose synthase/poly-beta-1,6-N-acetylglucosamine synthase-like glycosyltransferase